MSIWKVHALKYAERLDRMRKDSFIVTDDHTVPHPIDFFVWLIRGPGGIILVDTGYDEVEAKRRARPIRHNPAEMLRPFGVSPEDVKTIVITHLHHDHAGCIPAFPNATLHIQAAEMGFATGACMCHEPMRHPYSADHVCEAIRRLYSGRVILHEGDAEIADGVTVHRIGGHTRGLQAVRVRTEAGWLCLASDATHYYENLTRRTPFPLVVDLEDMMNGFGRLEALASSRELIVPGHDPLVCSAFPRDGPDYAFRLDRGPVSGFPL